MKAYKGFDKDLKCRGFQYEIGKTYETEKADLCNCGFHACLYPNDTYSYYPPSESRYCVVEIDGVTDQRSDDTKICGTKITIVKELTLAELVAESVDYIMDKIDESKKEFSSGNLGCASSSGEDSVALAAGYLGKAKACLGSAICVVERGEWNGNTYPLLAIKAAIVDGEKIKADTWYKLENGEFVEVEDEES